MYEDDYILRQVRQLGGVIARLVRGDQVDQQELDAAVRDAVGLDLRTIDQLPAEALVRLASPGDDRAVERLAVMADLLEAVAEAGPGGDARRAKARAIRVH